MKTLCIIFISTSIRVNTTFRPFLCFCMSWSQVLTTQCDHLLAIWAKFYHFLVVSFTLIGTSHKNKNFVRHTHQKHFEWTKGYGCGIGDTLWVFMNFLKPKIGLNLTPRNFEFEIGTIQLFIDRCRFGLKWSLKWDYQKKKNPL